MEQKPSSPVKAQTGKDLWSVTTKIPSHLKHAIVARKEAAGYASMNAFIIDRLISQPDTQSAHAEPINAEAACAFLFTLLRQGHQAMLAELVRENGTPLSMYMLSHLDLAHEQGMLAYRLADEQVPEGAVPATASIPATKLHALQQFTCGFCGKQSTQQQEGQKFCHSLVDGEESCGDKHARERRRSMRYANKGVGDPRRVEPLSGDPYEPGPRMAAL